jgi:predicted regulator of Ras-like GTPase activity (Roadblock/LC7/MglB family)
LPLDASRLAAMVSSMAALGDAASREAAIGQPHCMVVDSSAGRLVMRSVQWRGEPMVVVLLADTSALLGMVLNALNGVERSMGTA